MLRLCREHQWHIDDLDWSVEPRPMDRETERAVVQYFTDMAGIELLAGELFRVQRDLTDDPALREIFDWFVVDEQRHSAVAQRLADHYNVHQYDDYQRNPHLRRFHPQFVKTIKLLSPEIANAYITSGELLLDVALLRSLNDYVDDEMSRAAMQLINRDESRHIAIDFYMMERYATAPDRDDRSWRDNVRAAPAMARLLFHAGPFFRDVFFAPMDRVDPESVRLFEAFKRIQLFNAKEEIAKRPFTRFMKTLQDVYNAPGVKQTLGPVIARVMGLDPRVIEVLHTEDEEEAVARMSFAELAEETLALKTRAA